MEGGKREGAGRQAYTLIYTNAYIKVLLNHQRH